MLGLTANDLKSSRLGWRTHCVRWLTASLVVAASAHAAAQPTGDAPTTAGEPASIGSAPVDPRLDPAPAAPTLDDEPKNKAPYPRFHPSARLQTGAEYRKAFGDADDSRQPFFLDQARLGLDIEINSALDAAFDAELSDEPALRDAYLNLKVRRWLQFRAGHFKRPISRTELQGIGTLPFRSRGVGSQFLRDSAWAGRSLGVMAWGKLRKPKLRWSLALMNAGRSIDVSDDERLRGIDVLGRVEASVLPWLDLALDGGHKVKEPYPDGPNQQLSAIGADALIHVGALRCVLEARMAQNDQPPAPPAQTGRTPFALSLLGYATYDLRLQDELILQPIVAIERLDTDRDLSQDETLRAVAGLNLVLWSGLLRVLPQVEAIRPLGAHGVRSHVKTTTYYLLLSLQL